MSSPGLGQDLVGDESAIAALNMDQDSVQGEISGGDGEVDDALGLFGSDEEDEGLQYNATLSSFT
jgi:fructose-1,6-bisphosphatase/sedoheptulose 1,7-bisphosphatase-like protein